MTSARILTAGCQSNFQKRAHFTALSVSRGMQFVAIKLKADDNDSTTDNSYVMIIIIVVIYLIITNNDYCGIESNFNYWYYYYYYFCIMVIKMYTTTTTASTTLCMLLTCRQTPSDRHNEPVRTQTRRHTFQAHFQNSTNSESLPSFIDEQIMGLERTFYTRNTSQHIS